MGRLLTGQCHTHPDGSGVQLVPPRGSRPGPVRGSPWKSQYCFPSSVLFLTDSPSLRTARLVSGTAGAPRGRGGVKSLGRLSPLSRDDPGSVLSTEQPRPPRAHTPLFHTRSPDGRRTSPCLHVRCRDGGTPQVTRVRRSCGGNGTASEETGVFRPTARRVQVGMRQPLVWAQ